MRISPGLISPAFFKRCAALAAGLLLAGLSHLNP